MTNRLTREVTKALVRDATIDIKRIFNFTKLGGVSSTNSSGVKFYEISENEINIILGWSETLEKVMEDLK